MARQPKVGDTLTKEYWAGKSHKVKTIQGNSLYFENYPSVSYPLNNDWIFLDTELKLGDKVKMTRGFNEGKVRTISGIVTTTTIRNSGKTESKKKKYELDDSEDICYSSSWFEPYKEKPEYCIASIAGCP